MKHENHLWLYKVYTEFVQYLITIPYRVFGIIDRAYLGNTTLQIAESFQAAVALKARVMET